jgi:hypothetical protein
MARADGKEEMVGMEKNRGMIYWYLKWSHLRRLTPSQSSPFFATVNRLGLSSTPQNSSGKTASKLKLYAPCNAISTALLNFAGCAVASDTWCVLGTGLRQRSAGRR